MVRNLQVFFLPVRILSDGYKFVKKKRNIKKLKPLKVVMGGVLAWRARRGLGHRTRGCELPVQRWHKGRCLPIV